MKDNHHASHDFLLDTLYEEMKARDGSYFVAILPCLVVFGLSSELTGEADTPSSWDHGHKVIIWSHDEEKVSRVCQPHMTKSTAVLHASSLEDWLQSGCVPEGTKVSYPTHVQTCSSKGCGPRAQTRGRAVALTSRDQEIVLTCDIYRSCSSWHRTTRSSLASGGRRRRSSKCRPPSSAILANSSRPNTARIQPRLLAPEASIRRGPI